jgi:hypothetical protein
MPDLLTTAEKLECILVYVNSIDFWRSDVGIHCDIIELSGKYSTKIITSIRAELDYLYEKYSF